MIVDDGALSLSVIERIAECGGVLAPDVGADVYEHTHLFRLAKMAP